MGRFWMLAVVTIAVGWVGTRVWAQGGGGSSCKGTASAVIVPYITITCSGAACTTPGGKQGKCEELTWATSTITWIGQEWGWNAQTQSWVSIGQGQLMSGGTLSKCACIARDENGVIIDVDLDLYCCDVLAWSPNPPFGADRIVTVGICIYPCANGGTCKLTGTLAQAQAVCD